MPSFVDTNVLVYAEDRDAKTKHEVAPDLLVRLWDAREGVLRLYSEDLTVGQKFGSVIVVNPFTRR